MNAMSSKVKERTAEWIDSRPPSTVESPSTPTTRAAFRDGDTAISPRDQHGFERVPIRIHPRVFSALGADLVSDDVVAVIELVKNAYDACARNVRLRFDADESGSDFLEIEDDGVGMAREVIADAWCCVATPYRKASPVATRDGMRRRVVGEKGLGRLSAGRLGTRLHMLTQASGNPCWEVSVDWTELSGAEDLSESFVRFRELPGPPPFNGSGTRIHISGLREPWDDSRVADLEENLARLISPFSDVETFNIFLTRPGSTQPEEVQIEAPRFLGSPKYSLRGSADPSGNVKARYRYSPDQANRGREKQLDLPWRRLHDGIQDRFQFPLSKRAASCGPFSFEIRAWDIDSDATREIARRFDFRKSDIRRAIRAHKGISVYRDGVLVLPKSETARDWLGLDLRRISRIGPRLSTSQIVGYVAITAGMNPKIDDTSDRERLVATREVAEFEEILKAIVELLETERDLDRVKRDESTHNTQLFEGLSADAIVQEVAALSGRDAPASEAVPVLREFKESLDSAREGIREHLVHYSRLATVGTIAQMLVHEIRNRTTAVGWFLEIVEKQFRPFKEPGLDTAYRDGDEAVDALERLADTFAPLASRGFRRRNRCSQLEERARACCTLLAGEIARNQIRCAIPDSETEVAVDPGELDAIILNLLTNSIYWMREVPKDKRLLTFAVTPDSGRPDRIRVAVIDQGPGIDKEDMETVFWPGMTRKPGGIGMGLTVASELVASYGGRMTTEDRRSLGGASVVFDLPLSNRSCQDSN